MKKYIIHLFLGFVFLLISQVGKGQTLMISEVADPGDTYQARFVELYNATASSIDLSAGNWYLSRQSNGSSWGDIALTGTIASGGTYTVAYNSSDFNSAYGFDPDQSSGYISGNGDDGYFLYSGGDHTSGTLYDAYGVIDEDGTGKAWEYQDSHAVRNSSVCDANTTWTSSEWTISSANVADMTPGTHTCDCPGTGNDNDSQVSASSTLSEPATISSLQTSANGVQVFDFTFTDAGTADGLATIIDQLQITQGSANNVADWTDAIAGAVLNGPDQTNMTGTVNATNITFASNGMISVSDGSNETYTLSIWLKTDLSAVSDNDILEFAMDYTNITTDASGSSFGSGAPESGDNNVAIDITATELQFIQQPSDTKVNVAMSPDPSVKACDANGNIDTDYNTAITVSSDGTMTGDPVSGTWSSGIATFANLTHTVIESGLKLTASSGTFSDVISQGFNIIEASADDIIISEMCDPNNNYADDRYIEIYNPTASTIDLSGCKVIAVGNGSDIFTWNLSGTIDPCEALVCGDATTTASFTVDFADETWSDNNGTWNGKANDGAYYVNSSGTTIDQATVTSDVFENKTLVRNSDINVPNTTYTASEWTASSVSDANSGASTPGSHTNDACGCSEPTGDASDLTFPNIASTSMDLSWTNGDGASRIVVCREGAAVTFSPTDATTYSANSDYSAGAEVGTVGESNKIVYNGSGNSFTCTGLTPGTNYYFKIYEYNCSSGNEDYFTSGTPAEGNAVTLPENVSNFTLTCITNTTATLTWDLPTGGFDGILIAIRESTLSPSDPNCDGSTLSSPNTDFSSASVYCGNTTDSRYVYNSTGTSVTVTGLTPGADYVFKAFTYNGSDWSSGTQTADNASVGDITSEHTTPGNTQISVYWTNPTTCYDEIMVVAHEAGSVSQTPSGDGSSYTANSVFGAGTNMGSNDYVVYKGTNTSVDVTSLTNGTNYCFKIFVRKGSDWSVGVEICDTPADVTYFNPGEFVVVGFDSKVSGGSNDAVYLMSFVDIKEGTTFKWVNSRFEAGAAANQRTMHWGGSGDEPYADPAYLELKWQVNGQGVIPAGSIISFETAGSNLTNTRIDGSSTTDLILSSHQGSANVSGSEGDQMWLVQGVFTPYGTDGVDKYNLFEGKVLFGLTSIKPWVPITSAVSDDNSSSNNNRESRLHPDLECFNIDLSLAGEDYKFYKNGTGGNPGSPLHTGTKRALLTDIQNSVNWVGGTGTTNLDITEEFIASTATAAEDSTIGKRFSFNAGNADGTWVGGATGYETDWFTCKNWEGLTVPDETMDVTISNVTDAPVIDHTSAKAPKYSYIAECNNITIDNETLTIEGSVLDTLFVHGNITIQNSGILDMNSGGSNDGLVYISGNWNNQATFNSGKGTIVFNGINAQTITTSATGETFNNLRLTNNNLAGVTINKNIVVNDTLSQIGNVLNLNGNNIELKGVYENTNSYFEGDAASDFIISADADNGNIDSIYFKNDTTLNNFSIDRTGKSTVFMTGLDIQNNLTITAGNVTLTAGHNYDVDGTLTNTPNTAAALILKSDASGTASLIQQTGAVAATVERYLSGDNWHYIFPPLSQIDTAIFTVTSWGDINPNVYFYNEPVADFWQGLTVYNPTGWTGVNSDYLQTDRGYINYFIADKVYTQTGGNLTDADKSFTLSYTDNGPGNEPNTGTAWSHFDGWNLFGNPYVSAVDWDNASLNKDSIENFIYYYDDTQDKYLCYGGNPPWDNNGVSINGGTQYIPAGQAFMIKSSSTANGNPFIIPKTARVHNSHSFYKKPSEFQNLIRLQIKKDNYTDETIIRTLPAETNVTDEHDANYDAYKMFSHNDIRPQIYSHTNDNSQFFAVNTLSEINSEKVIPLGIYIGESGNHSIEMTENYFSGMHIWLEDRAENVNTNLLNQISYSFNQSAETNDNRFFLHFQKNTKPVLNYQIHDQETPVNQNYEYVLPAGLFTDNDFEDELIISATLENGDNLPEWLNFNSETLTFSGTPYNVQTLNIKVTAKDVFNESVSDIYKLTVSGTSSINDINSNAIQLYPNPVKDELNIIIPSQNINNVIIIKDITGKTILVNTLNGIRNTISMKNITDGIYIIEIRTKNKKLIKRIIKK